MPFADVRMLWLMVNKLIFVYAIIFIQSIYAVGYLKCVCEWLNNNNNNNNNSKIITRRWWLIRPIWRATVRLQIKSNIIHFYSLIKLHSFSCIFLVFTILLSLTTIAVVVVVIAIGYYQISLNRVLCSQRVIANCTEIDSVLCYVYTFDV